MASSIIKAITEISYPITQVWPGAGGLTANCINIGNIKIQWGLRQCGAGQYTAVYFKEPFTSTGYFAIASYTSNVQVAIKNTLAAITNQNLDHCDIYSDGGTYAWLCIGV